MTNPEKIPVYFMPGMAANASIFEQIKLPEDAFEMYYLEWFIPEKNETLSSYALRMTMDIKHPNPVLIGVSFGGILVQEMAQHIKVRKLIIISSIKSKTELPRKMIFARYTKVHKLLPTGLVTNMELLAKYAFGETINNRLELYEKYLAIKDKSYLDWAIDQIVNWRQKEPLPQTIHIQGEKDAVFPVNYIKNYIEVKNGTHIMIINKYKWFNENLPKIITT
jgi:pimeloyl-ACP methyl ester carboxylesterase